MKWPKKSQPITKKQWEEIKPEKRGIKQFIPREPQPRLGGKIDTTGLRFVDTASPKELREEFRKIQSKESKLPSNQRNIIKKMFA